MAKRERSLHYVSRGGDKLASALDALGIDVTGVVAADLGANVGGFTDCLLQRGAERVYAVETGYGVLEWKLRQDERVVVMERENALHVRLAEPVDLVVADVGWTPLKRVVPAAGSLLSDAGTILALLKHQYEAGPEELRDGHVREGFEGEIEGRVKEELRGLGFRILADHRPDVERGKRNPEMFLHLAT